MYGFKELLRETLVDPRSAAARVDGYSVARSVPWLAFALVCVAGAIIENAPSVLTAGIAIYPPIILVMALAIGKLVVMSTVFALARWMGGTGTWFDLFKCTIWAQIALLPVDVGLHFVVLILPGPMGDFVGFAALLYIVWVMSWFILTAMRLDALWKAIVAQFAARAVVLVVFSQILGLIF